MNTILEEVQKLSVSERIQLVEDIWDSMPPFSPALSQEVVDELHRRYEEHRQDPSTSIPWQQVRARLFS